MSYKLNQQSPGQPLPQQQTQPQVGMASPAVDMDAIGQLVESLVAEQVAAAMRRDQKSLDARDELNRRRDHHTGTQAIDSIDGLGEAVDRIGRLDAKITQESETRRVQYGGLLENKANRTELHEPIKLAQDSDDGLELTDGQILRYTAPPRPPEPVKMHAREVEQFDDISEPQFGVVYVVAGTGSFMLSATGDAWIQIAAPVGGVA